MGFLKDFFNDIADESWGPKIEINCPYCSKYHIIRDGFFKCEDCGNIFRKLNTQIYKSEETVTELIEDVVKLFAYISKSDGVVNQLEIDFIDDILSNFFELNSTQLKWCYDIFNTFKNFSYNKKVIENILKESSTLNNSRRIQIMILSMSIDLSYLTESSYENSKHILNDIGYVFDISLSEYESILKDRLSMISNNELELCFKLLGLSKDSEVKEIKDTYKRLMKIYHPDKYMSYNFSQDVLDEFTNRSSEITSAYNTLKDILEFN